LPALQEVDGEEPAAAGNEGATIVWHEGRITQMEVVLSSIWRITLTLIRPTDLVLLTCISDQALTRF
jgi:hypothetical protein